MNIPMTKTDSKSRKHFTAQIMMGSWGVMELTSAATSKHFMWLLWAKSQAKQAASAWSNTPPQSERT